MFKDKSLIQEKQSEPGSVKKAPDFENLKQIFSGEIILPGDISYEQASISYSHKGSPAVIVKPNNAKDVAAAIQFARGNSFILSIRSGGHGSRGFSTNNGGIIIDLSNINKVEVIDKENKIVKMGAGALWGNVAKTLGEYNLAISSGDTKSVGVGGLTVGGGIGWLVRKYGLTIDSLIAAEVVTSHGDILHVNSKEHPDLFWAIRGGGGNFGVVTNFEFTAQSISRVVAGNIQYEITDLQNLLKGWRDYMRAAPEEVNSIIRIMPPMFGNPAAIFVSFCYPGNYNTNAKNAIEPFLKLGKVVVQDIKEMNYAEVLEDPMHLPDILKAIIKNLFVENFSDELIQEITEISGKDGSPALQIRSVGGEMNRIAHDATAFAFRNNEIIIAFAAIVPKNIPESDLNIIMKNWDSIKTFGKGAYVNFLSEDENISEIYPEETYTRLVEIKKVYDPENIFNQNYNIKPA